jgi:AGZA family xanthine/uracil permease-like MFS transporter
LQIGLGIACWSGILFFVLTRLGLREVVTRSVPQSIKLGLTASIGLFVAILGFRNAGLVLANAKSNALMLGDFTAPGALIALCGLFLAIALQARRIPGAILWAILFATLVGIPFGVTHLPTSLMAMPHSLAPVFGHVDLIGALNIAFLPYLFVFFASEFFSTMGTTLAVGGEAGLLDEHGNMPHINRPFMVDSIAAALGPCVGIPAATALAAAVMFLLMLLFTPVALMIPKEATAPALILIGLNMFSGLRKVDLANFTDGLPVLMMVMITLIANSFGTGIAGGLLFYIIIKVIAGKWREVPVGLYLLAIPLAYYFATLVRH